MTPTNATGPGPDHPAQDPIRLHKALSAIWNPGRGWQKAAAVNHSVLGIRFMVTAGVFFLIGGLLAMVIRAQLSTPHSAFIGPEIYNQIFTMHGTIMMFLFAIPMLEGLAIYFLPKLLGARDLAFPRLTAFGYWCYFFGGSILIISMILGAAPDSGWFMYTPLSSEPFSPGINPDVWLLGVTFVEISAMSLAIELVVSILKMRAPGMTLDRMPIFAWYILITALMMILGFPPLILASILLEVERAFGLPFFDPERGGSPLLWQHLFWLFGHPEVYIIFLPAAGVLSTLIPVVAQRPLIGYRAIVAAIIAMAFLSFGIWAHHMYATGIPHMALAFFSLGSAAVAVPTAVQIFAWLGTLAHGRPRWNVPMLWVFGFLWVFVLGGLSGVMIAMVPFNLQSHDTYFIVAHLHYVLVGGFVFPLIAGLYYWLPLVTGREAVFRLAVPAFWLTFIGFNMTFALMHLTGLLGMPRRIFTYPGHEGWVWLNLLSSIGGMVLTMGFALIVVDLILQVRFGRRTRRDPWRAGTLDWAMPRPPAPYAFASIPSVETRADRLDPGRIARDLAAGGGYLAHARNGWQESLGLHVTRATPEQVIILPRNTYLPLVTGTAMCGFVLAFLFGAYWLAAVMFFVVSSLFVYSAQSAGQTVDHGPLPIGRGLAVPPHTEAESPPPWYALILTLVATGTILASLIYGTFYNWLVAPGWPPAELAEPDMILLAGIVIALLAASGFARAATNRLRAGASPARAIGIGLLASGAATVATLSVMLTEIPDPRAHAYAATSFMLLGYLALHAYIGLLFTISNAWRWRAGRLSPKRTLDLRLTRIWQDYVLATGILILALFLALPRLSAISEATPSPW
jgi:cytochrome c oxidase subunit I+III